MLSCLHRYDPTKDTSFLTFAHHSVGNALLDRRRVDCIGSFDNLSEYKTIRRIAWLYNDPAKTEQEAISDFSERYGLSVETAAEHLTVARRNQPGLPLYKKVQDEEAEETGEDVTCDDSWNYADILCGEIRSNEIQAAFEKMSYREQTLLEGRCAICMTCGRVSSMSKQKSFEDLAVMFEGGDTSGAERAYRRTLDKLTRLLVEQGTLDAVELRRKSIRRKNKKSPLQSTNTTQIATEIGEKFLLIF